MNSLARACARAHRAPVTNRQSFILFVFALGAGTAGSASAQTSVIETLTGPVTPGEVQSVKGLLPSLVPGETNNHNNYAYGNSGDAMEAMGDLFDLCRKGSARAGSNSR